MLQKIGAGLIDEPVGTSVFSHLESQLLDFLHSTVYGVKSEGQKSVRRINPLECADPSALSLFATCPGYGWLEKGKTAAVKPPQTKVVTGDRTSKGGSLFPTLRFPELFTICYTSTELNGHSFIVVCRHFDRKD